MRYLCLPTPVTYVPRLNTVRTEIPVLPSLVRMAHPAKAIRAKHYVLSDRHQAKRLPLRARIAAISDGPSAVSAEPSTTTTAPA